MKATFKFTCLKACRVYSDSGHEIWSVSVKASDLPKKEFSLDSNARYASLEAKPAKAMLETLRTDPSGFVLRNNGIMLAVDSIRVKDNNVEVVCEQPDPDNGDVGDGVLNGGHTYKVLREAMREADSGNADYAQARDAVVILTVVRGIEGAEIWEISKARNTAEKIPMYALMNLAGDWDDLKENLPEASSGLVAFKPNDPETPDAPYNATSLARLVGLLDNKMFPAEEGKHPSLAYSSLGHFVRMVKNEGRLKQLAKLLPDAIRLEELVYMEWDALRKGPGKISMGKTDGVSSEPTVLLSGKTINLTLPAPFVLPVIAAFRVFVNAEKGTWRVPLDGLWEDYGKSTVKALWKAYLADGDHDPSFFGRDKATWLGACERTKRAALEVGYIQDPEESEE